MPISCQTTTVHETTQLNTARKEMRNTASGGEEAVSGDDPTHGETRVCLHSEGKKILLTKLQLGSEGKCAVGPLHQQVLIQVVQRESDTTTSQPGEYSEVMLRWILEHSDEEPFNAIGESRLVHMAGWKNQEVDQWSLDVETGSDQKEAQGNGNSGEDRETGGSDGKY